MKHKDLVNINRVIEFIHEYKDCGLQETGLLDDDRLLDVLNLLEDVRNELIIHIT